MIDEAQELLIYLKDVPALLPSRPSGRPITVAAIRNWIRQGVSGVKLDFVNIGGSICTSRKAVARYIAAVTEAKSRPKPKAPADTANDCPFAALGGAASSATTVALSEQPAKRPRGRPRKRAA